MITSLQQASANALGRWLAERVPRYLELPTSFATDGTAVFGMFVDGGTGGDGVFMSGNSAVVVSTRWPEATLPPMAITILLAGAPQDEILQPTMVSSTPIDAATMLARWQVLERTQPLQLDVWAQYDMVRDALVAAMDQVLNLGGLPGQYGSSGLTLDLADGWVGKAAFDFSGSRNEDGPNAAQVSEWRATYFGESRAMLYVDAKTPKLASIKLGQVLGASTRLTELTASSVTHSS